MSAPALIPREVGSRLEDLLRDATSTEPWKTADSLSGSRFERVVIGSERFVLKHLHVDDDWIQRAQGDIYTRPLLMWRSGLFDTLPASLDHTIVDVAAGLGRNGWGVAILMRDVSPWMVDVTAGKLPTDVHRRFLSHMAELHAAFWGWDDTIGLQPMSTRYYVLSPLMASCEAERDSGDPVPGMVPDGWRRMAEEAPELAKIVLPLHREPWPLVTAQERGPLTLIHSDWKAGNLGALPDGQTVLIDWAFPGRAPAVLDLAWYIAVNCELLPHSKEETIEAYRESLEALGVSTRDWWEPQLELALLAVTVMLGWSKTGDELGWWAERVPRALTYLA